MAQKDLEARRAYQKAYYEANRDKCLDYQRAYKNSPGNKAKQKAHYEANREEISARRKAAYRSSRDALGLKPRAPGVSKTREYSREYYRLNSDRCKEAVKAWLERHPGVRAEIKARHRARKLQACPPWADRKAIREIYKRSAELNAMGIDTHVDHIVALHAVDPETREHVACGLHVHWNLRVILDTENCAKGSKLTADIQPLAILEWA